MRARQERRAPLRHLRGRPRRDGLSVHALRPSRRRQSLRRLSAALRTLGRPTRRPPGPAAPRACLSAAARGSTGKPFPHRPKSDA
jgi:hypothetical protein